MSKASVEIITTQERESFVIRKFDYKGFSAPFHFHPEYELTCITEGKGKRFVGNNMTGFQATDLVLLGSNLPHCWKLTPPGNKQASSIVIQFTHDFLGKEFFGRPEMDRIHQLLALSEGGLGFHGNIINTISREMNHIVNEKNECGKLIRFLEVLHNLSLSKEYILLNKNNSSSRQSDHNRARINKVFIYIVENFREDISLEAASKTIAMTPNAFCKYFKKITRKTFMETVIDYRINFATQQLIETDKPIADVCFESGFRDMSHFYKMFSTRMELSPLNYRKQYLLEIKDAS